MFNEELNLVKKEFSRQSPILPLSHSWYAGRATWARALKRRIDIPMKVWGMCAWWWCVYGVVCVWCGMVYDVCMVWCMMCVWCGV